ncbi:MAG TPA: APC family permease [Candidatus Dormibacteraeota bacterium]|nr:APC family permease [Candidatus Dormibacteraeota bacterium]
MSIISNQKPSTLFVREATGLVREISTRDAFILNLSASPLGPGLVYMIVGTTLFPGGDVIVPGVVATILSFFIAATYAQLSAAFPRSGGDYVFNSRILHPALGFGMNFSLTLWEWFIAGFYVFFVASSGISPALVIVGCLTHNQGLIALGDATGGPVLGFVIGTIVNVAFGLLILSGTKNVFRVLTPIFVLSLSGLVVSIGLLALSGPQVFMAKFNAFAAQWSSAANAYESAIRDAASRGFTVPRSDLSLLPPMIAVASSELIWYFWSTYLGGEIRQGNSTRKQMYSMIGSAALNGVLFVLAMWMVVRVMGYSFLASTTFLGSSGSTTFPFISQVTPGNQLAIFISLLSDNSTIASLLPILFAGWSLVILPALFLQPNRCIFSWAMDRIAPAKFAEVSEKFHTPIYPTLLGMVTCEISLTILTLFPEYAYTIFAAGVIAPAFASMLPTAFSALFLPKRRKDLYQLSGLDKTRLLGLPAISVTGLVAAVYLIFLTIVFFTNPPFGLASPLMIFASFGPIVVGVIIYYVAKAYRLRQGIELNQLFAKIPPE